MPITSRNTGYFYVVITMVRCKICNKYFKTQRGLLCHIKKHNTTSQNYYDRYEKEFGEGICPVCGNETNFIDFSNGYRRHCSYKCAATNTETKQKRESTTLEKYGCSNISQLSEIKLKKESTCLSNLGVKNPTQSTEIKEQIKINNRKKFGTDWVTQSEQFKEKAKQTCLIRYGVANYRQSQSCIDKASLTLKANEIKMIEKGYIPKSELIAKYGYGWYESKIVEIISYKHKSYISKKDLDKIICYAKEHEFSTRSRLEDLVVATIKKYTDEELILNSRKILNPYELDIYIPNRKLAIEVNGNYRHSIEVGVDKNYHFSKSILCRQNGINLIHLFEDTIKNSLDKTIQSILNPSYSTEEEIVCDFNLDNGLHYEELGYKLIKFTGPEIVETSQYTVYGSGKILFKKGN